MEFIQKVSAHPLIAQLSTPTNLFLLLGLYAVYYFLNPSLPDLSQLPNSPTAYNWRPATRPPTAVWRTFTAAELSKFDGTASGKEAEANGMIGMDGKAKILFAIRRRVYDVSSGRSFYGPGKYYSYSSQLDLIDLDLDGPYGNFAGRDASRGLAKQSFDADMLTPLDQKIDELADLSPSDWSNLMDWECE